jgi:[FeFe] hydrogenase H-cluster maturation GTPase HydF
MAIATRDKSPHLILLGRRNQGKSSLMNLLTGQKNSIVSDTPGTTTDPVKKSLEIHGVGSIVLIDTAGLDDTGSLGKQRAATARQSIGNADCAIMVISQNCWGKEEQESAQLLQEKKIPFLIVHNKSDLQVLDNSLRQRLQKEYKSACTSVLDVHTMSNEYRSALISAVSDAIPNALVSPPPMLSSLIPNGATVLLVTPIDIEAPTGRLILPQVQTIRDILDNDAIAVVLKEREVDHFLKSTGIKPALVISDSQVLLKVHGSVPEPTPLTGFSILLAWYKGNFSQYLRGTPALGKLRNGDRILLLESCTHHVSCDDIGRVKIPRWISQYTGLNLNFDIISGLSAMEMPVEDYALVIQCGGCMITRTQIHNRLQPAIDAGIPVTNYGMTIAWLQGMYQRVTAPFTGSASAEDIL